MKNRISTGALFAMLMLMAMLPRTGHSQEIDPNAYYEIVSSNNLVLDNQDSEDDGTQIFINNRVENRVSQVWQLTTPGYGVYKICTPLSDKCVDNNNTKRTGPGYPVGQRSDQYEPILETHEDRRKHLHVHQHNKRVEPRYQ